MSDETPKDVAGNPPAETPETTPAAPAEGQAAEKAAPAPKKVATGGTEGEAPAAEGAEAAPAKKVVPKKKVAAGGDADGGEAPAKKAVAKKAAAPVKKAAIKPATAGKKKKDERRFFLFTAIGGAWTMFTLAGTAFSLALLRFLFPNVLAEPPSQFRVGPSDQFEPGSVDERWKNQFQVWIINLTEERRLIALSTVCTHLGCTPSWLEGEQKFKCPCHGSGFYKNGINFEGPAPRPLERFAIYDVDGLVVVDKSKKFQFELGQWDEPESFLPLA